MHRPIFGHSFAVLVAPVLLSVLAFKFLNKKRTSARRNAEDVDTGASGSMAAPTETNSDGSSPSPTKANNGASSSMAAPTETNSDGSSPSPTKANIGASSLMAAPTETDSDGSSPSLTKAKNGASSSMAAPAETNSLTGNCYEVFLSFRGPDTRHGFTNHLYHGLLNAGIDAFRDDDELCHGEDIRPVLMEAITSSKILIPIFSVNYGTSSWCLDELVQIMERKNNNGQIVLPIFYEVKPAEVRYQTGRFGEAFHERESRLRERSPFDPTTLEKWKQALLEVSNLKGYEANRSRSEAELVKSVVQKVLRELKKKFELIISENLVGIDSYVKNVTKLLDDKSHARLFVGIHGMGGIGKTTLAKTIYNELSNQFKHRSFIADIRESWKRGAHDLQSKLISDISNQKNEVCNKDEGINFIRSKFKDKKVLLLLDDVDNVDQVRCLVGNHDWFSLGSMIIITARNKRILELARVDHIYDLTELNHNQSLILFSKHAFRKDFPPSEFEGLTREVVSTSGGLPLFLEVLGSSLSGKESKDWREMIKKLRKVPFKEVQDKLRISYDALEYEQQQIFLDIACFLIGTDETIAFYMWDACDFFPRENIEVLRFMSLIKIGDDHELQMHDQLRDLGRAIVREENREQPWHRSRLWDSEEASNVLKRNKGTDKIKAIDLSKGNSEGPDEIAERDGDNYTAKQFKKLTSLRVLFMTNEHLSGDFKDSMEELRWLQWLDCPTSFEVNNFCVKKLVVLELRNLNINEKWEGWKFFMMAEKLKYLDLSCCQSLENTDFLLAFKKLEVLFLHGCWELKRIDDSIEDMEGLLYLMLDSCVRLRELPAKIGKLKSLQHLNLKQTTSLFALPNSIGSLENLEILNISWSGIEELPNGIGNLRKLRELLAWGCRNLKGIMVESMCNLSSLRLLDFKDCTKLQSLPNLPFGLTYLGVTCQSRKLPSLFHLPHLKELEVRRCEFIQCIQELPSMQLKSSECSQLRNIEKLESPQSLNTPFKLEILHVWDCESIKTLDVSQFIHLRELTVMQCKNLLEFRVLDKSIYLERLSIVVCISIKRLDLPKLEGLKELDVGNCFKLAEIQVLDKFEYLETLDTSNCTSIERLDLPKFRRLKELNAQNCQNLAEIEGLDRSEYLESLNINWCTLIERLDLPKSGRLKKLQARGCVNLAEIQGLDRLEYLERLEISECTSMERLDISGCTSMERLDISRCTSMERLSLPKSKSLDILKARDCANLVEIQGLDGLKLQKLKKLNIIGCESLKTIPKLFGTRIYPYYKFADRDTMEYEWDSTDDSDE